MDEESKSETTRFRLLSQEGDYSVGTLGGILIAVTRQPPTLASVENFVREIRVLAAEHPAGVSLIFVPRAPRPALSPQVMKVIAQQWSNLEPQIASAVVLFRATGFVGAIQRSLVTTVLSMRRSELPLKFSSSPFEAAEWVTRHGKHGLDARPLGAALRDFVAEHEQR